MRPYFSRIRQNRRLFFRDAAALRFSSVRLRQKSRKAVSDWVSLRLLSMENEKARCSRMQFVPISMMRE